MPSSRRRLTFSLANPYLIKKRSAEGVSVPAFLGRKTMIKNSDSGVGGDSRPEGNMANFSWVNPRQHPRFQARLKIRTDGAMPGSITTRNISLGGAFGETSLVFPVGTQVACILYP